MTGSGVGFAPGFVMLALLFIFWFHTVIRREPEGHVQPGRGPVVPHGNDVVIFSE